MFVYRGVRIMRGGMSRGMGEDGLCAGCCGGGGVRGEFGWDARCKGE